MARIFAGPVLFTLGLAIAIGAPLLAQELTKLYTSRPGSFQVAFPEKPRTTEKELSTGGHIVKVVTERSTGPRDTTFAVVYADYPRSYQDIAAKTILDGVRDGMTGTDGKVIEDRELGDMPPYRGARAIRIEAGRNVIKAHIYLVGTRLYQVMVTGPKTSVDKESTKEFFQSFEITK
jgi:hypothetical protein